MRERIRKGVEKFAVLAALASLAAASATSCSAGSDSERIERVELGLGTPVTTSFQNGVAPSAAYAGTIDTSLKQASATTNFGSETTLYADGDDGSGIDLSLLVAFSLSGIPAGSVVQSASISFRVTNGSSNSYDIYAVSRAWSESEATWQKATNGASWASAGAMGAADRGAVVGTITGSAGNKTVTLNSAGVSLVQSWVDGGTNAGVIIASASNTDGLDVASSEHATLAYRPRLSITYAPPAAGGGGGSSGSGGTAGTGGSASGGAASGEVSTDPNLKVAFIGDTDSGSNFTSVLDLVKNEGASALVVQGDMSYSANPSAWWNALEGVLGTSFPVFISRGNHDDSSWSGYLPKAASHLGGATRVSGAHDANYKTTYRGLVIATAKKGDTGANLSALLSGDNHIWKICNWHQNQAAMQIGGKGDEMGWDVYETCRNLGAIIETGHEHSYERSKTLTNMALQTVDPTCATPGALCVGPGRTFSNVVGLGGNSVRDQSRCLPSTYPYGCNNEWAFIYTSQQSATHGAQFITFNAGNEKTAVGYFKNVNGATVDTFTIQHD